MRRIMMAAVASLMALAGLGFPTGAGEKGKVSTPFNGKDLTGWKLRGDNAKQSKWKVDIAEVDPSNPTQLQLAPIASDNKGLQMVNTAGGGLYGAAAPRVNAARKPGEWQKFVIEFQAPRFEGGKKTSNARFLKVTLNDQVIHENVEMKGPTPSGVTGKEAPTGPLMFQGDHGPVAYRNIRIITK
ncbi:MAG: DUF1080 domain-containing protein [Gemmataceae bacterium]|nr:DUF1080 domain-containing protein [Gemmataceae bacterium]